jgi:hypothetical protein
MSFGVDVSNAVLGRTQPRLWTPPLVELTPDTSYGYDVCDFADTVLGTPLDPWEQWVVIHLGELLPDGRPRFRVVLILVARQNGKTLVSKVLIEYWMFVEKVPMVLGTSTNRDYAKRIWKELCDEAQTNPLLSAELGPDPIRRAIGEEHLTNHHGSTYKFAANNRRAGRSLTVHRLVLDELREHHTWDAWSAATNAGNAVPQFQCIAISNQGDDKSIVLDALRGPAIQYIETGVGDPRLGLFEYSSPPGSDPTDLEALAYANPNLGRRIDPDALRGAALRAKAAGGEELAAFKTEAMCLRTPLLNPAIDPDGWRVCGTDTPVDLAQHRRQVVLCIDLALDGSHATLVAAAAIDGKVHTEVVEQWDGHGCAKQLRIELPKLVAKIRPRAVGWFPSGPAASIAADLTKRPGWPPRRVELVEIHAELAAVCMGLSEQVAAGEVAHPKDDMQTQHIGSAQKLWRGDRWVFVRRGASPIDGAYATAGAVHLARTLPPALPPLEVV